MPATEAIRPLLLNSEDLRGGAARAAYRLHEALRAIGVDARMLVQVKHGDAQSVLGPESVPARVAGMLRPIADLAPLLAYRARRKTTFYPGWLPDSVARRVRRLAPDLLHLHWITGGFLKVSSLRRLQRPLVWTLHDMWAFTGGCHYDEECGRYATGCGRCPALGSRSAYDLSYWGWSRKARAYAGLPLHIVTPSRWLAEAARASPLLSGHPVRVIPNAIDTRVFRPIGKTAARDLLGLPQDRRLVLFGALFATSEPRKGYRYLEPALAQLARLAAQLPAAPLSAVVFGATQPAQPPQFGMPAHFLGTLSDDVSLAALYSAADVFIAPSIQENLSNTVLEALACGTPVVSFDIGGMPDMIEHRRNGYLARPFEADDLAQGLHWVLESPDRHAALGARARAKILEEFEAEKIARRHVELYREVLDTAPGRQT